MIVTFGIIGVIISSIGIIKRVKLSLITLIMWCIFIINIYISLSLFRGSLIAFVVGQAAFLIKLSWIIYINRHKKRSKMIFVLSSVLLLISAAQFLLKNIFRDEMGKILDLIVILNIVAPVIMLSLTSITIYSGIKENSKVAR